MIWNWIRCSVRAARWLGHFDYLFAPGRAATRGRSPRVEPLGERRMLASFGPAFTYNARLDLNGDDLIDALDRSLVAQALGPAGAATARFDLNEDGAVNAFDLQVLAHHDGAVRPTPGSAEPLAPKPAYEALYDMDGDWDIDAEDVAAAATLFGSATAENEHVDFDQSGRIDAFDIAAIAQRTGAMPVDLNQDGVFNAFDFGFLAAAMASANPDLRADLDGDGDVDHDDLARLEASYDTRLATPPPVGSPPANNAPPVGPVDAPSRTVRISPETRIGAYYDMAGNPSSIRSLSYNVQEAGWQYFIETHLQPVADSGVPFAEFHNIWGRQASHRMSFPIFSELAADPELPLLIDGFVPAFRAFHDANPSFETIAYVGSPYTAIEVTALEDNPQAWWDVVYETIIPLVEAGFRSIGFDASGWDGIWQHPLDLELYEVLMNPEARLRDRALHGPLIQALGGNPSVSNNPGRPVTVYFEALPVNNRRHGLPDRAGELGHNHMIVTYQHYRQQDPERRDEAGALTAKHPSFIRNGERHSEMEEINVILPNSSCTGEVGVSYDSTRAGCLQEMRNVLAELDRNTDASGNVRLLINPRFLVSLDGNQVNWPAPTADTYSLPQAHARNSTTADFVQELELSALPTRINLDPQDYNPPDATYWITASPQHGTLTQSIHDPAVLVYTPERGYKGTDSFEYSVSDGTHQATGRITLVVD